MHTFLSHLSAEEPFTFLGEGLSIVEAITFLNQSVAKPENHNLEMFNIQVNFFQKHLFLHKLTHNMAKDCSLNYEFST